MKRDVMLMPCPCCGGRAVRKSAKYNTLGAYGTAETDKKWYGVYCKSCRLSQPARYYFTREDSDNAWNRRVSMKCE